MQPGTNDPAALPADGGAPPRGGIADGDMSTLIAANLVAVVVYVALAELGLHLSLVESNVSLVWPPAGLALALVLLWGPRLLPAVTAGATIATALTGAPIGFALATALGNTLEAGLGSALLRRWRFDHRLETVPDVGKLALVGAGVAPIVSTAIGMAGLYANGMIDGAAMGPIAGAWWLGNAMAVLVITPASLSLAAMRRAQWPAARLVRALGLLTLVALAATLVFGGWLSAGLSQPLAFALFPLLVMITLAYGTLGASSASLVSAAIAVWGIAQGHGPFAGDDVHVSLIQFDVFLLCVTLTGLLLAAFRAQYLEANRRVQQAAQVFRGTGEGVLIADRDGLIVDVNEALCRMTAFEPHDLIGRSLGELVSADEPAGPGENFWTAMRRRGEWRGDVHVHDRNGDSHPEWLTVNAVRDAGGAVRNHVGVFRNMTEIKRLEQRLNFLAHHDALTELPNRLLLDARLAWSRGRALRLGTQLAVLFIDLDRFKHINDSLSHAAGDDLLRTVAERLRGLVRDEDTVARAGGDEFIVACGDMANEAHVMTLAQRVLARLQEPIALHGQTVRVTASIGISLFPDDAEDTAALLRNADAAMYQAKSEGRNGFAFYTRALTERASERVRLESDLREALASDDFQLHYQPQVCLQTGSVVGLEALVRWRSRGGALVMPGAFIPFAEEVGLIGALGDWILRRACSDGRAMLDAGLGFGQLSVNISGVQLQRSDFLDTLDAILRQTGFPANRLALEITEGMLLSGSPEVVDLFGRLRALGVHLVLDDFGTGYSSMSHLHELPLDGLKIDKTFVLQAPTRASGSAIVRATLAMASELGIRVLAEGVEEEDHRTFLCREGGAFGQGWLFCRDLVLEDLLDWLANHQGPPTQNGWLAASWRTLIHCDDGPEGIGEGPSPTD